MGMNPTPSTLLGDGVASRTALSSGHPRDTPNRSSSVPIGMATVPGTRYDASVSHNSFLRNIESGFGNGTF